MEELEKRKMIDPNLVSGVGVILKCAREIIEETRHMRMCLFAHKYIAEQGQHDNPYVTTISEDGTNVYRPSYSREQQDKAIAWLEGYLTAKATSECILETFKELLPTISAEEELTWAAEFSIRVKERKENLKKNFPSAEH
jgi:hypothetical protein